MMAHGQEVDLEGALTLREDRGLADLDGAGDDGGGISTGRKSV